MTSVAAQDVMAFYAGLPSWVADAGLSKDAAQGVADDLEALVEFVQEAGYPPADVGGPDPSSFPPPSDRIAGASNQLHGLLRGLDEEGWETVIGGTAIADRCVATQSDIIGRSTTSS